MLFNTRALRQANVPSLSFTTFSYKLIISIDGTTNAKVSKGPAFEHLAYLHLTIHIAWLEVSKLEFTP